MAEDFQSELGRLARDLNTQVRLLRDFGLRGVARCQELPPLPEIASSQAQAPSREPELFPGQGVPQQPAPVGPSSWQANALSAEQAQAELEALKARRGDCRRCRLCEQRRNIVFGAGDPKARLVLVGEGPGAEEDRTGHPFVGAAGQLLEKILAAMGLTRQQVYICNVVKCRPPQNRTPEADEMATCGRFLAEQLKILNPRHIICLGATAAQYLLNTKLSVSKLRGRIHDHPSGVRVLPTYHPAYLLRNPAAKKPVWQDVQLVMAEMGQGEAS